MSMTKMKKTVLSVCALLMMAPSVLKAQDSTVNTTTVAPSPAGANVMTIDDTLNKSNPFALNLALEMAEKVQKDENTPKENSLTISIEPVYKINSYLTGSAKIAINQDNFGQHETTISDGTASLAISGYELSSEFRTVHSLGTVIPASDKSVKTDRLKGTLSTSNGIAYSGTYFSLTYRLGLVRFFHEFTQNADGNPNLQYRISHLLDLKIPITDQLSLSTVGSHRTGWTYNSFQRFSFVFDADLNYDLNKNLAVFTGVSTDGNAVKSNGVDSNITVFDENRSSYRIGVSYLY